MPLRIRPRASYDKGEVFEICDTLARAERALQRAGEPQEAAKVAVAFDILEAGLT